MGQPKESDLKGLPRHVGDLPRAQGGPQNFVEKLFGKKTESQEWQEGNSNLGGLITDSTLPTCTL